jgi:predicted  nucleic acid-binding Zn-ribbon protein
VSLRKIDVLHQLQDYDSRIDGARAAVARLETEIADPGTIAQLAADVERTKGELHQLETQQRDLELQADTHRGKIASDEGKLYGGRISNPKELSSLQDEVAQDRRQLSTIEDRILELLDRIDEKTRQLNEMESVLARETQSLTARHDGARSQLQQTQGALQTLTTQRDSVYAQVDAALRPTYETLRRQKGGLAVATVQQRTCQACRVSLTPAQEQRARIGNEIVMCHSCGRILFVPLG